MMRLLYILWKANIALFAIVIPLVIIGTTIDVYEGHTKQSQQDHIADASTATTTHYAMYLEAPASPKYYEPKPKPVVKVASYRTYANKVLLANSFVEPITEILQQIINCESNGNPLAKNPHSTAKGLFQILDGTWKNFECEGNVFNSEDNYRCGYKIATQSGLHHWNASRACWDKLVTQR
jgi:hypothetical protein